MSNVPEKMVRLAAARRTWYPIVVVLAAVINISLINEFLASGGWLVWLLAGFFGQILFTRLLDFITMVVAEQIIYRGNMEQMENDVKRTLKELGTPEDLKDYVGEVDEPVPTLAQVSLTVVDTPKNHAGTYKDAKFYDWLILKNNQTSSLHHVVFDGIIDTSRSFAIPDDCFLLEPGLLYKQTQVTK